MRSVVLAIFVAGLVASAPATAGRRQTAALSLTPSQVAEKVVVTEDPFLPEIILDTSKFYSGYWLETDQSDTGDSFVRAFIDRKTKSVAYQIYFKNTHTGLWHFFKTFSVITPDGPRIIEAIRISEERGIRLFGVQFYDEDVAAPIPPQMVDDIAARSDAGQLDFKVFTREGFGIADFLPYNEIRGLRLAVENQLAKMKPAP